VRWQQLRSDGRAFVLHHRQRDQQVGAAVVLRDTQAPREHAARHAWNRERGLRLLQRRSGEQSTSISSMDASMPYTSCAGRGARRHIARAAA
jgi:hypothetical protein